MVGYIRDLQEKDLKQVLSWRNSKHIQQYMYTDKAITWKEHLSWYKKVSADANHQVFIYVQHDKPLGLVQFYQINKEHQRCFWGLYIGEQDAPKGAGTNMASLALTHIFAQDIQKVCAEVIESNVASLYFHQKLGFKVEGTLRRHMIKAEHFYDIFTLGLLKEDWKGGGLE